MQLRLSLCLAGLFLSGPATLTAATSLLPELRQLVPSGTIREDWQIAEQLTFYEPETLYEYVNGGAPQYLSYGFVGLAHIRYAWKGEDLSSVALDLYDMGSPLGAYGIYSSGRRRDIEVQPWGVEGYLAGTVGAAWKGQYYVHVSADDDRKELLAMATALVQTVMAAVPGPAEAIPLVGILPRPGLIRHSDRYVARDLFGHSFLPGGLLASYRTDGGEALLFLSQLDSEADAREAFEKLEGYELEKGQVLGEESLGKGTAVWAEDPGLGPGLIVRVRHYLAGVWGSTSRPASRKLVLELIETLSSR